jgi:phage FluMu gp28-like protein
VTAELVSAEDWAKHRREQLQELPPMLAGRDLPDVLLPYQKELLASTAVHQLVATDKSRRVGATWGVGADAVLTSAATKAAGGMDTLYLGYNLDMAREFIDVCAMWARAFAPACSDVQEFLFREQDEKGADRAIQAFRISFASGYEIVALSSKPRSLRGRQGYVILDEFAFHDDADALLKAAMALLIWGGKVLVISTHNGVDNPFNELLNAIRSGRRPGHVVRITFDDALRQGLYQRVCLTAGIEWSPEREAKWRDEIRASYGSDAAEELDCIPSQGSGVYLSTALIEACMTDDAPVLRLSCPQGFDLRSDEERHSYVADWIGEHVDPLLDALPQDFQHAYGFDFGRSGDLSVLWPLTIMPDLMRRTPFLIELRNVPFRQQEQLLFHVADRLPRLMAGKHDARGNGQFLAEYAQQRYGADRIEAVMLSQAWYLANTPKFKAGLEDRLFSMPRHADVRNDLRQIKMVRGIPKVPDDAHTQGTDGGQRHGDAAVAAILATAAAAADVMEYGYAPASALRDGPRRRERERPADVLAGRRSGGLW